MKEGSYARGYDGEKVNVKNMLVQVFATPWTVAHQAPVSLGFSGQEYWSQLPFPPPGDLPNPGIEARSSVLQAGSLSSEPPGKLLWWREVTIKKLLDLLWWFHEWNYLPTLMEL